MPQYSSAFEVREPVYKFDAAGYQKFAQMKTQKATQDVEQKAVEESKRRDAEVARKEAIAKQQRMKAEAIEKDGSNVQFGRVRATRAKRAELRKAKATAEAQRRLEEFKAKREKELQKEVKSGESQFKTLTGYQNVVYGRNRINVTSLDSIQASKSGGSRAERDADITNQQLARESGLVYDANKNQFKTLTGQVTVAPKASDGSSQLVYSDKPLNRELKVSKVSDAPKNFTNQKARQISGGSQPFIAIRTDPKTGFIESQKIVETDLDSGKIKETPLAFTPQYKARQTLYDNLASDSLKIETDERVLSDPALRETKIRQRDAEIKRTQAYSNYLRGKYFEAQKEAGFYKDVPADVKTIEELQAFQTASSEKKTKQDESAVALVERKIEAFNKKWSNAGELPPEVYNEYLNEKMDIEQRIANINVRFSKRQAFYNALDAASPKDESNFEIAETSLKSFAGTPAQKAIAERGDTLRIPGVANVSGAGFLGYLQRGAEVATGQFGEFSDVGSTDVLKAPTTFEEKLDFRKDFGTRMAKIEMEDPYDTKDLQEDLGIIGTDVAIGAGVGAVAGTIVPGAGTGAGAITGGLSGLVGGTADVLTDEFVFRQTGSREISQSAGFVTGFGAAVVSAGPISKGVSKIYSYNPRVVGKPQSIARDLGDDTLQLRRYSQVRTGVGPLGKSYDVVDDLTISRIEFDDILRATAKTPGSTTYYNFEPFKLSDDVFANRYTIDSVAKPTSNALLYVDDTDVEKVFGRGVGGKAFKVSDDVMQGIDFSKFEGFQRIKEVGKFEGLKRQFGKGVSFVDDSVDDIVRDTGFAKVDVMGKKIVEGSGRVRTFDVKGITASKTDSVDDILDDVVKRANKTALPAQKKLKGTRYPELGRNQLSVIDDTADDFVRYRGEEGLIKVEGQLDDFLGRAKTTKQGTDLFTDNFEDYSKAISFKQEKGLTKSLVESGDETLISPTQKFRADTLTFAGKKGSGSITKLNIEDYPEEFILRIEKSAEVLPKGTKFTDLKVSKTKPLRLSEGDDVLKLSPPKLDAPKTPKLKLPKSSTGTLTDAQLDDVLKKSGLVTKTNIKSLSKTGTLTLQKTGSTTGSISGAITSSRTGTGTIAVTKVKPPSTSETGKTIDKVINESKTGFGSNNVFKEFEKTISDSRLLFSNRFVTTPNIKTGVLPRFSEKSLSGQLSKFNIKQVEAQLVKPTQTTGQPVAETTTPAQTTGTATSISYQFDIPTYSPPRLQTPTITTTPTPTPPPITPNIKVPPTPRIDLGFGSKKEKEKPLPKGTRQGYNVYVRKGIGRGIIDKVLVAENVPKKKAIQTGLKQAAKYTQRTAIIEKGKPTRKKDIRQVSKALLKQFRGPKPKSKIKENGAVFVEKSKHAIDTKQEKEGIPYKAATQKRLFSGSRKIKYKMPKL